MGSTTVIYATYDGIATMQHGIGTQTRAFMAAVDGINASGDIEIAIAFPSPEVDCLGYSWNDETSSASAALCRDAGIELIPLAFRESVFWTQDTWIAVCSALIDRVTTLLAGGKRVVVLAVDAVFSPLSTLSRDLLDNQEFEIIHTLYSSARVTGATNDPVREAWEVLAIENCNAHPSVHCANVGTSFTEHLRDAYGLQSDLLPFRQSIALDSPELMPCDKEDASRILELAGIPADRLLVVAASRSDPIKGLQDFVSAMELVAADVLFVIIAVPYHQNDPHLAALVDRLALSRRNHVLVRDFDRALLRALSSVEATRAFVVPSRGEPIGMAPQEVALWARFSGPVVAASDCDGLAEQITHRTDGFLFPPGDAMEMASTIDEIVRLREEDHAGIRHLRWQRVLRERNFNQNLAELFRSIGIYTTERGMPQRISTILSPKEDPDK